MKKISLFKTVLFIPAFFSLNFTQSPTNAGVLVIEINNIKAHTGDLHITIFNNQETFLKDKQYIFSKRVPVDAQTPSTVRVELPDFPFGTYAVTVYHDINFNHIMDQNGLGIPTEPYGLSNNVKVKWRRPRFDECSFSFTQSGKVIPFELKLWKER